MTDPYQQYPQQGGQPAQPGYGTPAGGYGTPAPGYGAPGYGTPAPGYGAPGYGTPAPGYGAPTGGPPGGGSAIALDLKHHPLAFMFAMFTPVVTVDGYPVPGKWGRTVVPVAPGQHQVHVHCPYLLPSKVGPADAVLPVQPGQCVELEYKAPLIAFIGGSLGAPPQKYNGATAMIVITVVAVLLALCSCGLPLLSSLSSS